MLVFILLFTLLHLSLYTLAYYSEELLFRAIICTLLRSAGVSSWATVILSPTLFGLAHVHHFYNHTRVRIPSTLFS